MLMGDSAEVVHVSLLSFFLRILLLLRLWGRSSVDVLRIAVVYIMSRVLVGGCIHLCSIETNPCYLHPCIYLYKRMQEPIPAIDTVDRPDIIIPTLSDSVVTSIPRCHAT